MWLRRFVRAWRRKQMPDHVGAIATIRDAVCALLRVAPAGAAGQFQLGIVGTTWCVSPGGAFVTAFHVLNEGSARDPAHKYYVLRAPGNGTVLQYWPVQAFQLEDQARDMVVLHAPLLANAGFALPSIPVALAPPPDGTSVLTYGCPAPVISGVNVTNEGNLTSLQTILFTHGNTGIVAAQYPALPTTDILFEFSVGWHHGESGGPVLQLEPVVAAFAVMQNYRDIEGPHGPMAGPRRGLALASIRPALLQAGATFV
jgi:hypothetical protein